METKKLDSCKEFVDKDLDTELKDFIIDMSNLVQYNLDENPNVLNKKSFLSMILVNTKKFIGENY